MPVATTRKKRSTRKKQATRRKPVTQTIRQGGWQVDVDTPQRCPVYRGKGQSAYIQGRGRHELYFRHSLRKWEWRGTIYRSRISMIRDIIRFWARQIAREEYRRQQRKRSR